ncbi:hypothetical protein KBB42_02085 [Candidatus Dojkabacteria bacterium]|nr:hypothetical protein [Candidatus Dojkabacteria bacterium]
MEYVLSVVAFLVVTGIMTWWYINKRNEVWKGELIKKNSTPGDMETNPYYYLVFKTEDGKKKKFSTPSEQYWNTWEVGDKGEKVKGEFFPKKI